MKLATWNILFGTALQEGKSLTEAVSNLDVDVLALQEVDYLQPRSGNRKMIEEISQSCSYSHWIFAPTLHGTPGSSWTPATDVRSSHQPAELPTSYGIGLLSRIPVLSWHNLNLGKSPVGLPLAITTPAGTRLGYVPDEPRVAVAAVLENNITVITAHLSFVPPVNSMQLGKIKKWARTLPGKKVFLGDFNALLFGKSGLASLHKAKSYPGWGPKVKFDFILSNELSAQELPHAYPGVSDHLPLVVKVENF